ncbi:hypothetical protein BH10PSE12_BH10PSE12_03060 [soil metagenome]
MLKTPSEFPYPGSEALFAGTRVRIISHADGGLAFVSGKDRQATIARTVRIDQLLPVAAPRDAIEIWADKRIATVGRNACTLAKVAWIDFRNWYRDVYQAEPPIGDQAFKRALLERGFSRQSQGSWAFALNALATQAAAA